MLKEYFAYAVFFMQASGGDKPNQGDKKKKESIVDLGKYLDKPIRVKFQGGREGKHIDVCNSDKFNFNFVHSHTQQREY